MLFSEISSSKWHPTRNMYRTPCAKHLYEYYNMWYVYLPLCFEKLTDHGRGTGFISCCTWYRACILDTVTLLLMATSSKWPDVQIVRLKLYILFDGALRFRHSPQHHLHRYLNPYVPRLGRYTKLPTDVKQFSCNVQDVLWCRKGYRLAKFKFLIIHDRKVLQFELILDNPWVYQWHNARETHTDTYITIHIQWWIRVCIVGLDNPFLFVQVMKLLFHRHITAELHLSGLIGRASHPDMQKIRKIGFFF